MEINDFLSPGDALVKVRSPDKISLLRELALRAASALNLESNLITNERLKRESLSSTGIGGGVAIPHARMPELKKSFGTLVRLKQSLDFDAIDSKPVDVVFLLLMAAQPEDKTLNELAYVSRKLRDAELVRRLRNAADNTELYKEMQPGP